MKTVFITGSSSGIGKETALYFLEKGWQVVATMRHPEKRQTDLHGRPGLDLVHLDVEDPASIRAAVQAAANKYPTLDVLVNNAGYSLSGLFENATAEQVEQQYRTNVLGLMAVTREFLPIFRKQRAGVLVNVASIGGRLTFPFYSLYNSTKWAVEGFSEGLHYELEDLNIKVKIIEPGIILTDFYDRSMVIPKQSLASEYGPLAERFESNMRKLIRGGSHPRVIAKLIHRAATDNSRRLRYAGGRYARFMLALRRLLPDRLLHALLKRAA
ncbi:MAG: SDR family oxidoreductase [candidate division FCPU426 bacterium]